jgi:hypothetical protein
MPQLRGFEEIGPQFRHIQGAAMLFQQPEVLAEGFPGKTETELGFFQVGTSVILILTDAVTVSKQIGETGLY